MRTFTRVKGYVSLRRLSSGESRWFWSYGREFGLWYLTVHAFWLHFAVIGPFDFERAYRLNP